MPIGKNSIKRVKNNGYSNVKTLAPDMENSSVIANPSPEVIEKMIPSSKSIKEAVKKSKTKKKPSSALKKQSAAKPSTAKPKVEHTEKDGSICFSLGSDLPEYLL